MPDERHPAAVLEPLHFRYPPVGLHHLRVLFHEYPPASRQHGLLRSLWSRSGLRSHSTEEWVLDSDVSRGSVILICATHLRQSQASSHSVRASRPDAAREKGNSLDCSKKHHHLSIRELSSAEFAACSRGATASVRKRSSVRDACHGCWALC